MITTHPFTVRYHLNGVDYAATVCAWNVPEARAILQHHLARTIATLPAAGHFKIISVEW